MPLQAAPTALVKGTLSIVIGDGANVVLQGDLAYVSDENIGEFGGGFFIVDVSDPSALWRPMPILPVRSPEFHRVGLA